MRLSNYQSLLFLQKREVECVVVTAQFSFRETTAAACIDYAVITTTENQQYSN